MTTAASARLEWGNRKGSRFRGDFPFAQLVLGTLSIDFTLAKRGILMALIPFLSFSMQIWSLVVLSFCLYMAYDDGLN